jgi:PAS domain S-box-containing protein
MTPRFFRVFHEKAEWVFLRNLLITVCVFVAFYIPLYAYLGALQSSALLLAGLLVFTPLQLILAYKNHLNSAKLIFICSCCYYVLATPLGSLTNLGVEFYFFPALILPLLLFAPGKTKHLSLGMMFPAASLAACHYSVLPRFSNWGVPQQFPESTFRSLNVVGSFLIACILVRIYGNFLSRSRSRTIRRLENLTKRLRLESERTRRQAKHLEQTMEAIDQSALVAFTDESGRILKVNTNFALALGYSPDQLIGRDHHVDGCYEVPGGQSDEIGKCLNNSQVWSGEMLLESRDKRVLSLRTVVAPLFDSPGKQGSRIAIHFDQTSHKEALEQIEEAQELAKIGTWSLKLGPMELNLSPQAMRIFGFSKAEKCPSYAEFLQTILPEDRREWTKLLATAPQPQETRFGNFRVTTGGEIKWLASALIAKYDLHGNVRECVS